MNSEVVENLMEQDTQLAAQGVVERGNWLEIVFVGDGMMMVDFGGEWGFRMLEGDDCDSRLWLGCCKLVYGDVTSMRRLTK